MNTLTVCMHTRRAAFMTHNFEDLVDVRICKKLGWIIHILRGISVPTYSQQLRGPFCALSETSISEQRVVFFVYSILLIIMPLFVSRHSVRRCNSPDVPFNLHKKTRGGVQLINCCFPFIPKILVRLFSLHEEFLQCQIGMTSCRVCSCS